MHTAKVFEGQASAKWGNPFLKEAIETKMTIKEEKKSRTCCDSCFVCRC